MKDPRYPIGKAVFKERLTSGEREALISQIADAPAEIRSSVNGLSDEQLDTPYRDGGWTVRQVVHHVVDSHTNSYIRYRLILTQENPTIQPYDQSAWAELSDAKSAPVGPSLSVLDGLHERWVLLLRSLKDSDFLRKAHHPEQGPIDIDWLLQLYAWHGRHHTAHISGLRSRNNW